MSAEFENDESHPIPWMDVIDVETKTDKGAYYGLAIASPLAGDEYCQRRLLKKIEGYLTHIREKRREWQATHSQDMKARLYVAVHPDSDPVIFELLSRCNAWAEENSVEFKVITTLTRQEVN